MTTGILILLIAIFSIRYCEQEKQSILIFAAICGFFQFFHNEIYYLVGVKYYLSAAFADLFIIHLLSKISRPTNLILAIQKACLWFIYLNLFGWITYEAYYKPLIYNFLCESLFVAVLFASINKRKKDGLGNHSIHSNSGLLFGGYPSCALEVQNHKETQRS